MISEPTALAAGFEVVDVGHTATDEFLSIAVNISVLDRHDIVNVDHFETRS